MLNPLPARQQTLTARANAAYVRHVKRPDVFGAWEEHLRLWQLAYTARAATNDGNPVFASVLLPKDVQLPSGVVTGLPLLPAGVRCVFDEAAPNTLTVTVDVAAAQGVQAIITGPDELPVVATVVAAPFRTTITAPVGEDGIYTISLSLLGAPLATLLVLVPRTVWRYFREESRHLGFAFRSTVPPAPTPAMKLRLALLIGAESAAQTGNALLADTLRLDAEALPPPPLPTHVYPFQ